MMTAARHAQRSVRAAQKNLNARAVQKPARRAGRSVRAAPKKLSAMVVQRPVRLNLRRRPCASLWLQAAVPPSRGRQALRLRPPHVQLRLPLLVAAMPKWRHLHRMKAHPPRRRTERRELLNVVQFGTRDSYPEINVLSQNTGTQGIAKNLVRQLV